MGVSLSLPQLGKHSLTFSSGDLARQAQGSVVVEYGDTLVLATVCIASQPQVAQGFLPLTVEYQEKTYAMGKIPGGFIKREGRPKDTEILSARLIDRPLRPLFPKGLTNEIQIIAMVLSSDAENDPDVLAINGASSALFISDIPFYKPVGAVRIAKLGNEFIVNPTYAEREKSCMDLVVVGTEEKVVMLEGRLNELSEDEILKAIQYAQAPIKKIIAVEHNLRQKLGKEKKELPLYIIDHELYASIKDKTFLLLEPVYGLVGKDEREKALGNALLSLYTELHASNPELTQEKLKEVFFSIEEEFVRKKIIAEERRPDNRSLNDIRPIECKVRVLPRTHGSAIFRRGQTQSLAVTTLGSSSDEQLIEALEGEKSKHFMLHYLFPPFSTGDIKPLRGPSRREIGHGALAEKAFSAVIPSKEEFPYTIRVVSEILESNGSSSMASVCAASLSLMDAGVPIRDPVAGIAIGLIAEGNVYKVLTDIAGVEDFYGDMDFKIAGTKNGITTIQLDTKMDGIDYAIIAEALERARQSRFIILEKMNAALSLPRQAVSPYAPKIKTFKIDPDKIGAVIGPGGKIIRRITCDNNVMIDIDDEMGCVSVVAEKEEDLERAVKIILSLTKDIEVGEVFEVKITRITNFGAFCEIVPGKSGLIHVSEIADTFVKDVRDFLTEGQIVKAKVVNIDNQGRITLSIKQLK